MNELRVQLTAHVGNPDYIRGRYYFRHYLLYRYMKYLSFAEAGSQLRLGVFAYRRLLVEELKSITDEDLALQEDNRHMLGLKLAANEKYGLAGKVITNYIFDRAWNHSVAGKISDIFRQYEKINPADPFQDYQALAAAKLMPEVGREIGELEAQKRRERIKQRVAEVGATQTAKEEGITRERIYQILNKDKAEKKS